MHSDTRASTLARARGARALTCGVHVVFGHGELDGSGARELLLHELVHVLQQTGERQGERWRGRACVGSSGPPQRKILARPSLSDPLPSLQELGQTHRGLSSDPAVVMAASELSLINAQGGSGTTQKIEEVVTLALASGATPELVNYAYDLAKVGKLPDKARALALARPELQTSFLDESVVGPSWGAANPFDWIPTVWDTHPLLASFRLSNFLHTFTRPLLSSSGSAKLTLGVITQTKSATTPGGAAITSTSYFEPFAEDLLTSVGGQRRKDNELLLITLWALHAVNDLRLAMLGKAMEAGKDELAPLQRVRAVQYVLSWAKVLHGIPHEDISDPAKGQPVEVQALLRWVAPYVGMSALLMLNTWAPAVRTFDGTLALDDQSLGVAPAELLFVLREGLEFEELRALLDHVVEELLKLEDHALPERDAYAKRIESLTTKLGPAIKLHDGKLIAAGRKIREFLLSDADWENAPDREDEASHALALLILHRVRAQLLSYSKDTDAKLEAEQLAKAQALLEQLPEYVYIPSEHAALREPYERAYDYRGKHRFETAEALFKIAGIIGLTEVAETIKKGYVAAELDAPISQLSAAQRANLLIIHGEWEESSSPVSQIFDDISEGTLRGLAPLTLHDVYHVTLLDEFVALNRDLGDALVEGGMYVDAQGNPRIDYAPEDNIINIIASKQAQRVHPRRWLLPHTAFRFNRTPAAERQFGDLLLAHPKTKRMRLAELLAKREWGVWNASFRTPVVLWTLPDIKNAITRLRDDKRLNAFVDAYRSTPGQTPRSSSTLNNYSWLMALRDALEQQQAELGKATQPKATPERVAVEQASEALARETEMERKQLIGKLRQASILTRIYYTETLLRPLIAQSSGQSFSSVSILRHGEFLRYDIAETAQQRLWQTVSWLNPPEDRDAHRAAMVAALAPTLLSAWAGKGRYSLIVTWRPIVNEARKFLANPSTSPIGKATGQAAQPSSLDVVQLDSEKAERGKNLRDLDALEQAWAATVTAKILEYGLVGREGEGEYPRGALQPAGGGITVPAGKGEGSTFIIGGVEYGIKEVYKTFSWFGPYRPDAKLGRRSDNTAPDSDASMLFMSEEIGKAKVEPYVEDRAAVVLLKYTVDGEERELHGDDDHALGKLSSAVALHGIVQSLLALADAIETGMGFVMDGIELIPGAGQVVAATRIAGAVYALLGSDEFDQLLALIRDAPLELLQGALTKLDKLLTPTGFWQFLLLAQFPLPAIEHTQKSNAMRRAHGMGKLGKILRRIAALGVKFSAMLARFQRRLGALIDRMRLGILQRPPLARFIGKLGRHVESLRELELGDIFSEPAATAQSQLSGSLTTLGTSVRGIFGGLTDFTVPQRIIPLAEVFELVIDILVRRLGGKYKYAARGFIEILELTGLKSEILEAIESRFPKELNPNTYLVETFKSELETRVQAATTGLFHAFAKEVAPRVDALVDSKEFSNALGGAPTISIAAVGEAFPGEDSGDAPELQPKLQGSGNSLARAPPLELRRAAGRGQPLGARQRVMLERRFGHDFGHVRVHSDAAARELTRQQSAAALTSGSHVFLGERVDAGSSRGESVLRHELAHVLQQTGARPLDRTHSSRPTLGRPARGLVVDPSREAVADRLASETGSASSGARSIAAAGSIGVQPSLLSDVVGPVLTAVSDPSLLSARATAIDETGERDGVTSLDRAQGQMLLKIWKSIQLGLSKGQSIGQVAVGHAKPFDVTAASKAIQGRFHARADANRQAIGDLGKRATERLAAKNPDDEAVDIVRPARFQNELITYLFASTGILLQLELDTETVKNKFPLAAKPDQPWFKEANPVKSCSVVFVNLAEVYGGDELWTLALKNTWPADTDDKARASRRARVRGVLREQGVSSAVWHASEYKFGDGIVAEEKRLETDLYNSGGADKVDAKALPSKADYLTLDKIESNPADNVGLRLGHFIQVANYSTKTVELPDKQRTKLAVKGQQRGLERESHHTTQYLLLEFFRNTATQDAFPLLEQAHASGNRHAGKDVYPGITATDDKVDAFTGVVKFPIKEFEANRGGLMPALLIARVTHRTGGLHINATSDDFGPAVKSPGGAIQSVFRSQLSAEYRNAEQAALAPPTTQSTGAAPTSGPAVFQAYVDSRGADVVRREIESAMLGSYRWMYFDRMKPALADGLKKQEMEYYNDLARAAGRRDSELLTAADMSDVAEATAKHNVKIMRIAGFDRS